jgi:hypothetical protein
MSDLTDCITLPLWPGNCKLLLAAATRQTHSSKVLSLHFQSIGSAAVFDGTWLFSARLSDR